MSKSILIIDTPKCCEDCQFYFSNISWYCLSNDEFTDKELVETITTDFSKDKPSFCPLKPIPQKKDYKLAYKKEDEDYFELFAKNYVDGWNDLLDEILDEVNK